VFGKGDHEAIYTDIKSLLENQKAGRAGIRTVDRANRKEQACREGRTGSISKIYGGNALAGVRTRRK
jgi:hypothetical protein